MPLEDKTYILNWEQDRKLWHNIMTNSKMRFKAQRCLETIERRHGKVIVKYRVVGKRIKYYKEGTRWR